MQLAGDPRPLLGDGVSRPLLTLSLEPICAFFYAPVLAQLRAERIPGEPDDDEQEPDP